MAIKKVLDEAATAINAMEVKAKSGLLSAYRQALTDLRVELAQIYAKHEVGGVLTYSEMSKYGRLNSLFETIAGQVKDVTGETHKITRQLAGASYQESFYRTAFALETAAKVRLGFNILKPEAIAASVQNPLSGLTLNERLAANRVFIERRLREQITQGMIRGESYGTMAKRLKDVLEGDATKALRIAGTETHRNYSQGMGDADDKAGESGLKTSKEWVSTLDNVTRDSHADMDGQQADADGMFTLVSGDNKGSQAKAPGLFGIAAEDIECRCRDIIVFKGYEPELRRQRDEGIIQNKTYNEWKEGL